LAPGSASNLFKQGSFSGPVDRHRPFSFTPAFFLLNWIRHMPKLISAPTRIPVPGGKFVDEYVGKVNSQDTGLSVAHMRSPAGWSEPGQRPDFDEYTIVLKGALLVEHDGGLLTVPAGQAVIANRGEWVRYSTPDGAEYVAICLPAFTVETVHRDPS
jgi:hypothetical protein